MENFHTPHRSVCNKLIFKQIESWSLNAFVVFVHIYITYKFLNEIEKVKNNLTVLKL